MMLYVLPASARVTMLQHLKTSHQAMGAVIAGKVVVVTVTGAHHMEEIRCTVQAKVALLVAMVLLQVAEEQQHQVALYTFWKCRTPLITPARRRWRHLILLLTQ